MIQVECELYFVSRLRAVCVNAS